MLPAASTDVHPGDLVYLAGLPMTVEVVSGGRVWLRGDGRVLNVPVAGFWGLFDHAKAA